MAAMPLRISVIIPALNEGPLIAEAVERAWKLAPDEVIVVDGESADGTAELAHSGGAQVHRCSPGRAKQLNLGASRAAGECLLFLHVDTWLAPDGLSQIREALAEGRAHCGAFRQCIEAAGRIYRWLERGNAWRARRRGLPYGDQGIFVRRALFEQLGGFPQVRLMEDVLLMKALRRQAWPVLLPGPLYVSARRWRRYGVLRQTARNWLLLSAARAGVHPDRLARFYSPHAATPSETRG